MIAFGGGGSFSLCVERIDSRPPGGSGSVWSAISHIWGEDPGPGALWSGR